MYLRKTGQPTARKIPVRGAKDTTKESVTPSQSAGQYDEAESVKVDVTTAPAQDETDWHAMALRLQADMDNFRKRQRRRADDAIDQERARLLQLVLPIADNLARALNHDDHGEEPLRRGVELIHRELMRILEAEGVTRLQTVGESFDPTLHEAIATVPTDIDSDTIIEEIESGYKLGDKLLRPARVVVAA